MRCSPGGAANIESSADGFRADDARGPRAALNAPAETQAAAEVDLSRTMAIPRELCARGGTHEVVRTGDAPAPVAEALALRVTSGAWARSSPSSDKHDVRRRD